MDDNNNQLCSGVCFIMRWSFRCFSVIFPPPNHWLKREQQWPETFIKVTNVFFFFSLLSSVWASLCRMTYETKLFFTCYAQSVIFFPALTGNQILRGGATRAICDFTSSLEAQSSSDIQQTEVWRVKCEASSAHTLTVDLTVKQDTSCVQPLNVKWKWSAYFLMFLMRYNMHVWRGVLKATTRNF